MSEQEKTISSSDADFYLRITYNIKKRVRKNIFHKIIKKYSRPVKRVDVIDLKTLQIVEDGGYLRHKKARPFPCFASLPPARGYELEAEGKKKRHTKRRRIIDESSSSEDEIAPSMKRRRINIIASSDSEDDIPPLLNGRQTIAFSERPEAYDGFIVNDVNDGPPAISPPSSPLRSPPVSPSLAPAPRGRGRPKVKKCMRPRDACGRFLADPTRVTTIGPKRKRRTEVQILLDYPN